MNELTTLSTLAVEIDALNEQANIYANQAVIYAAKSGQKLLLAKAQCVHGQFKTWMDENCKLSYTTAKKYMQLVTSRPDLLNSNRPLTGVLPSISQMIELLSADEEVNEVVTAKIEAGEDVTIKEIQRLKKEAADLAKSKQTAEKELFDAKEQLKEATAKVDFQKLTVDAINQQNDDLRNTITAQITAGVAEKLAIERENMMQKNINAIHEAEEKAKKAQLELEKLKKEQEKAIKDGVSREVGAKEIEISQLQYRIGGLKTQETELKQARDLLEKENGAIKQHQESIKDIREAITDILGGLELAEESGAIPIELMNDWKMLNDRINQVAQRIDTFCNRDINSVALVGELVEVAA